MRYQVEDNILYWWNGVKWLIKETLSTETKAKEKQAELQNREINYKAGKGIKEKKK